MTPRQADRLINTGQVVNLYNRVFHEWFYQVRIISRTRWSVKLLLPSGHIAVVDRGELAPIGSVTLT